jgi:membrane protease YdiL (CAAX protease family)
MIPNSPDSRSDDRTHENPSRSDESAGPTTTWTAAIPAWDAPPLPWTPFDEATHDTDQGQGYELPARSLRFAVLAVVAILVGTLTIDEGFAHLKLNVRAGSLPAFLFGATSLLVSNAIVVGAIYLFAIRRGIRTRDLGLSLPKDKSSAVVLSIVTWVVFMLAAGTWITVTTPSDEVPGSPVTTKAANSPSTPSTQTKVRDDRHVLIRVLQKHPHRSSVILIVLATCFFAPLFEELFFRGLLFITVAARFGHKPAALASGILFGAAHFSVVPARVLPVLGFLGVGLGLLRHWTGSLLPGVGVHAFVNALATGISAGFGVHTLTLIIGSWVALLVTLWPVLRRNTASLLSSTSHA